MAIQSTHRLFTSYSYSMSMNFENPIRTLDTPTPDGTAYVTSSPKITSVSFGVVQYEQGKIV